MNYKTFKTNAVVIREEETGEANKILFLYTENFGRIKVLAKGIRKIKAKLKGGFQVLNYISLEFIQGKNFFIATDAILRDGFLNIKKGIKEFRSSIYICSVLDKLIKGEERDERIWNLFFETLHNLQFICPSSGYSHQAARRRVVCSSDFSWPKPWRADNLQFIIRYFEWNLFCLLGFEPELYHCASCQNKIQQGKFYFSLKEGGILCAECWDKDKEAKEVSRDVIKILRLIILQDKKILGKLKISSQHEKELKEISKAYLEYISEEEIFVV